MFDTTLTVLVTATNGAGSGTAPSIATGLVGPAGGRVFYISDSSGNDSNSGTSKTAPWQHAPGMNGCTASCAAYVPVAGDRFIFKGGDSWPNSAFPLSTGSGIAGRPDYYGIETDWFTGSSFASPFFSAGGSNIAGDSDALDGFINASGQDYVEIDGIHFTGWTASNWSGGFGSCAVISLESDGSATADQNITVNRIAVDNVSIDQGSDSNARCTAVMATTASPWSGNSIVENSTITGGPTTYGEAIYCMGNAVTDTLSGFPGLIYLCGHGTIRSNNLGPCDFPASATNDHGNAIESLGSNGTFYVHDNVIHDTAGNDNGDECE